ncbi:MAG: amidohydrolase, partial [Candidatus Latescibacterota bacterium]
MQYTSLLRKLSFAMCFYIGAFLVLPNIVLGAALHDRISKALEANRGSLLEFRRDLHIHPELSGVEKRTAQVIARRLRDLGLEVRSDIGGHGVVGILRGGKPGPVVAYRADIDAVLSTAPDPVEFASVTPGVRHICGHDMHATIAVAIATAMADIRDELAGTVMFIFQPAEENATGANAMLEDGVIHDPVPEAIYALHCAPLEVGQLGVCDGMLLPGLDLIHIALFGEGDRAAAAGKCSQAISGISEMGRSDEFIAASVF